MRTIRNFTYQKIFILPKDVVDFTFPLEDSLVPLLQSKCLIIEQEGTVKVSITRKEKQSHSNVTVNETRFGSVDGLPPEKEGVIIIVPAMVYIALHRKRKDIVIIDEPIRTKSGKLVACRSLSRPVYKFDEEIFSGIKNQVESSYSRVLNIMLRSDINEIEKSFPELHSAIKKAEVSMLDVLTKVNNLS